MIQKETSTAILILNYNGWDDTIKCIKNIFCKEQTSYPIILIDNGSTDRSVYELKSFFKDGLSLKVDNKSEFKLNDFKTKVTNFQEKKRIVFIEINKNLGGSGGRNVGIEWILRNLETKYIFFLDNDAFIESSTISEGLSALQRNSSDLLGCLVRNMDGSPQFSGLNFYWNIFYVDFILPKFIKKKFDHFKKIDLLSSCGLFATRDLLLDIKERRGYFFDEKLFHWSEDHELSLITKKANRKIAISEKSAIYHKISQGSTGLPTAYYYSTRNRIFIANRYLKSFYKILFHIYYPAYRLVRSYWDLFRGEKELALFQLKGLVDGYRGKGGKIGK